MDYRELVKDPRYQAASQLFATTEFGWGMPKDPHAKDNLEYACGKLAVAGDDAERAKAGKFLVMVAKRYLGAKYQDAVIKDIQRLARAASTAKAGEGG